MYQKDPQNNYVSVGGVKITDYAEWGEGLGPARGLDRITFWLNSNVPDGDVSITVTVNGVTSNPISFTVNSAKIYFISVTDGDNNYNGQYATYQGGNDGPFKDIKMFNPAHNPSGWTEPFIVYVRGGTYTNPDELEPTTLVALKAPPDSPDLPRAIVGYPGEVPVLDLSDRFRGAIWSAAYSPYKLSYSDYTVSKLKFINGATVLLLIGGENNRFIGNIFAENRQEAWSGVVMIREAQYQKVYGNYFYRNGYDSYKHEIYVKTHGTPPGVAQYVDIGWNEFDSWTANLNPDDQPSRGGAIFISTASDAYDKGGTNHVYIHDNDFHDGDSEPIYTGDGGGRAIYVYNNIFRNVTPGVGRGIYLGGTLPRDKDTYFYNNVFFNVGQSDSPIIHVSNAESLPVVFENNIFYARAGQPFIKVDPYKGATFSSAHDLYYDPDGSTSLPSGTGITVTNAITGDPLFVDAPNGDFHLQAGSPAIDAGAVPSVVTTDFEGNIRPIDGDGDGMARYDVGVYEYCPSGANCATLPYHVYLPVVVRK